MMSANSIDMNGLFTRCSPRDHLSISKEFPRQLLWCVEGEPNGSICAFRNITLGIPATHIGSDPSWAGCVYGDSTPRGSQ